MRRDVNPLSKSRRRRQGDHRFSSAATAALQSAPTLFSKALPKSCQAQLSFCSTFFLKRSHQLCPDTVTPSTTPQPGAGAPVRTSPTYRIITARSACHPVSGSRSAERGEGSLDARTVPSVALYLCGVFPFLRKTTWGFFSTCPLFSPGRVGCRVPGQSVPCHSVGTRSCSSSNQLRTTGISPSRELNETVTKRRPSGEMS